MGILEDFVKMLEDAAKPGRKVFILAMNDKTCKELVSKIKEASDYEPHLIRIEDIEHLGG